MPCARQRTPRCIGQEFKVFHYSRAAWNCPPATNQLTGILVTYSGQEFATLTHLDRGRLDSGQDRYEWLPHSVAVVVDIITRFSRRFPAPPLSRTIPHFYLFFAGHPADIPQIRPKVRNSKPFGLIENGCKPLMLE